MINLAEAKINFDDKNIPAVSNEELIVLAEKSLIEKRETGRPYHYVEAEADGTRFSVFIRLREKRIEWLRLSWLDSPLKGWDDVSEKAMKDEYRLLSHFVEKMFWSSTDHKRNRQRTWRFKWGKLK